MIGIKVIHKGKQKMRKLFCTTGKRIEPVIGLGLVVVLGMGMLCAANVGAASFNDGMRINQVYLEYQEDVQNGMAYRWKLIPNKYVPVGVDEGYGGDAELPSSYNLRDEGVVTQIKNQGSDGICWSYAIITAMESNLKKQGISEEFSAKQLDYLLAPGTGYYSYMSTMFGASRSLGGAGNFTMASLGLSSRSVPASEAGFFAIMKENDSELSGYSSYGQFQDFNRIDMYLYNNDGEPYTVAMESDKITEADSEYIVDEYEHYYAKSATVSAIKNAVYNNGAVYVGTYMGAPNCYDITSDNILTIVDRGGNVCSEEYGHGMVVIGWDDNWTYKDPASGNTKQGAFILQNSWGENDLLEEYDITYERMVETGVWVPDEHTEEENESYRRYLEGYNGAYTYLYLAYDFEDDPDNGSTIDFASLKMAENNYKYFYDLTDEIEGFGTTANDEGEIVYVYDTDGGEEQIDAIAIELHGVMAPSAMNATVYVDSGEGYKLFGSTTVPQGIAVRHIVEAKKKFKIKDEFRVKVQYTIDGQAIENIDTYYPYFTTTVYANDVSADGDGDDEGDDGDGENEGEDTNSEDEEEEVIKVPNTGLFTGGIRNGIFVVSLMMLGVGAIYVAYVVHKNRKEIFHKVDFDKK